MPFDDEFERDQPIEPECSSADPTAGAPTADDPTATVYPRPDDDSVADPLSGTSAEGPTGEQEAPRKKRPYTKVKWRRDENGTYAPSGKRVGRPSKYSEEIVAEICDRVAKGRLMNEVLRDPDMPTLTSVWRWLEKHESFRKSYARARLMQADEFAAETLRIASEQLPAKTHKKRVTESELGTVTSEETIISDSVARAKLIVDTRKWLIAKLNPARYGDNAREDTPNLGITDMFRALRGSAKGTEDQDGSE